MVAQPVTKPRKQCPLYCTTNHKHGSAVHAHLIAEVGVHDEYAHVAVNLIQEERADRIVLALVNGLDEPAGAHMTADEALALRDALNVAVAVLKRT